MIFMIKFQSKKNGRDPNSYFTQSIHIEHPNYPPLIKVKQLIERVNQGEFDDKSIEIHAKPDVDSKKIGLTPVYRLNNIGEWERVKK